MKFLKLKELESPKKMVTILAWKFCWFDYVKKHSISFLELKEKSDDLRQNWTSPLRVWLK